MNEQEQTAYVDYYLDNLKSGEKIEDAIHSLIEIAPEATNLLLQRYENTDKPEVREGILEVFKEAFSSIPSESQQAEIINLFGKEILSNKPETWMQALDVLAFANNDAALTHLQFALEQAVKEKDLKKEAWIREVLEDWK